MLLIKCPWCGYRDQTEFSYGGEAHITRPTNSEEMTDAEWADYLFMRKNTKGKYREQWCHTAGCRQWFNAERDTVSYKFNNFYKPADPKPGESE